MRPPAAARSDPTERRWRLAVGTSIVGLAAWRFALVVTGPIAELVRVFASHDDAFYYFQIAWNLAHGAGSTFDGIHPTNGYQPLWCWLLAGAAKWCSDRTELLRVAAALAATFHLLAGVLLARAAARLFDPTLALVTLAAWTLFPAVDRIAMLEAPIHAVCFALALNRMLALAAAPNAAEARRRATLAGVALAVLALARLDALVLGTAWTLATVAWRRRRGDVSRPTAPWARLLGPSAVAVGIYALANRLSIGSAWPISGLVKQRALRALVAETWRDHGWLGCLKLAGDRVADCVRVGPAAFLTGWLPILGPSADRWNHLVPWIFVGAAAAACVVVVRSSVLRDDAARSVLASTTVAVAIHFACMIYLVGVDARPWQWTASQLLLGVLVPGALLAVLARLVRDATLTRRIARVAALVGVAAMTAAFTNDALIPASERAASGDSPDRIYAGAASVVAGRLPPGTRVGAFNAGALAYFSNLTVINLDGLVNAPSFADELERLGWLGYLDANRIEYVSDVPGMYASLPDPELRMRLVTRQDVAGTTYLLWRIHPRAARSPTDARPIDTAEVLRLVTALGGSDAALRGEAARVLESIEESVRESGRGEDLRVQLTAERDALVAGLAAAALAPDPRPRQVAMWWVALLRPDPATVAGTLERALADPEWKVRQAAAAAAGALGAGAAWTVPRLIALLDDPAREVREGAADALGEIGVFTEPVVRALERMGSGDDDDARTAREVLAARGRDSSGAGARHGDGAPTR
ncbi:MAG: HEAT repeat domain-containing protein [bacterium]